MDEIREVLKRRAERLALRGKETIRAPLFSLLCFRVGRERYGIEIGATVRILPFSPKTLLPTAPAEIAGVINLQGEILTVLSLKKILGIPLEEGQEEGFVLLLNKGDIKVGLAIDGAEGVREIFEGELTHPEKKEGKSPYEFIKGITKDGLIVLDLGALFGHRVFETKGETV